MELPQDLVSQFVKISNDNSKEKSETTVNATYKVVNSKGYVQIDGSDTLTPAISTVAANDGDRVIVMIKNHTATITGNITAPSINYSAGGTITGIMMNGESKGTGGVVDLGIVLTEHQQIKTVNGVSIIGDGNIEILDSTFNFYDKYIDNCNTYLLYGYSKTQRNYTLNLPSEVIGTSSEWGIICCVCENNENGTGVQTYQPVNGDYAGRMFTRHILDMKTDEPIPGDWHLIAEEPTVLYENTSGTTGTVTLSQTAANFNRIEIFYHLNWNTYMSTSINSPDSKRIAINGFWPTNTGTIQLETKGYVVHGTTIVPEDSEWYCNIDHGTTSLSVERAGGGYICKVIGYR